MPAPRGPHLGRPIRSPTPCAALCLPRRAQHQPLLDGAGVSSDEPKEPTSGRLLGVVYALAVGCFGGSMLAPLAFVPPEYSGLKGLGFIPSFGTGSLLMGTFIIILLRICKGPIKFACSQTLWAGLTSGGVWQIGNVCQVVAQSYYGLPYAIACARRTPTPPHRRRAPASARRVARVRDTLARELQRAACDTPRRPSASLTSDCRRLDRPPPTLVSCGHRASIACHASPSPVARHLPWRRSDRSRRPLRPPSPLAL